jgi:hypothetical protein
MIQKLLNEEDIRHSRMISLQKAPWWRESNIPGNSRLSVLVTMDSQLICISNIFNALQCFAIASRLFTVRLSGICSGHGVPSDRISSFGIASTRCFMSLSDRRKLHWSFPQLADMVNEVSSPRTRSGAIETPSMIHPSPGQRRAR